MALKWQTFNDVTENNPIGFVYILGNEDTVGGVRLVYEFGDDLPRVEKNIAGEWVSQGEFSYDVDNILTAGGEVVVSNGNVIEVTS